MKLCCSFVWPCFSVFSVVPLVQLASLCSACILFSSLLGVVCGSIAYWLLLPCPSLPPLPSSSSGSFWRQEFNGNFNSVNLPSLMI